MHNCTRKWEILSFHVSFNLWDIRDYITYLILLECPPCYKHNADIKAVLCGCCVLVRSCKDSIVKMLHAHQNDCVKSSKVYLHHTFFYPLQGRRKVSNIGEAPIKSVPKFPENIGGAQLLVAPNIGGARAPVPPMFLRP